MIMLLKLPSLFILTFIKLTVQGKLENNIYYVNNSKTNEEQVLKTTTNSIYDYGDYDYSNDNHSNFSLQYSNVSAYDCKNKKCVVKCCQIGQFFIAIPSEKETPGCNDVSLYNVQDWKPKIVGNYTLIFGLSPKFQEESLYTCTNYELNEYSLKDDGTVYLYNKEKTFSQESYCIDNLSIEGKINVYAMICDSSQDSSVYLTVADYLHTIAVGFSTISLFIMVLIYIFTPHKLDIQKRCTKR
ncbi:hypothetical protein Anas_09097 [Armadillidium nasatum]|uniref:Methuselah N-terminal domain-containing protein n=1 Tax=Armadillidium nasatum TaxID=96803 RepID=A0A5N5TBT6_9CRUS|nr:hypothetical protein Anas_09097 [Armadillidium nasatum]